MLNAGNYRIVRFIAAGGFGCTYEAEHVLLEKRVAIKEFFMQGYCNRDADTRHVTVAAQTMHELVDKYKRKFIGEARALSDLHHEGIVSVSNVFEENGTAYFVMDYVDGQSLAGLCKNGPLPEKHALFYIRQVCEALIYVHDHNRLHLDLKPGNIMVKSDGRTVLIDFGASKQYDIASGENTTTLLGYTPGYAPLEQTQGDVRQFLPSTDIYALGATLYCLLTGRAPQSPANRLNDEEDDLALPANISAATRHAVERALEIRKKDRPQSVREFMALLDAAVKPQPAPQPPAPQPAPEPGSTTETIISGDRQEKSFKRFAVILVVSIVVGIALIILFAKGCSIAGGENVEDTTVVNDGDEQPEPKVVFDGRDKTYTANGVSFTMKPVAGGTFTMGATSEQQNPYDDEKPTHTVTLSDYYIGETEVTQELWTAVMGSNPSYFRGNMQRPVEQVSWDDCQTFIQKLNALTGANFRLPTEAEWEFAARGGRNSRGYQYSGSSNLGDVAWYRDNSSDTTHPVKTKSPNELGIYDMSGNVWEWCQDWYGDYSSSSQTNPTGPSTGSDRVFRGGSWNSLARRCRSALRNGLTPSNGISFLGLRLVL